jgi:signal transduction histidine kinase
MIYLLIKIFFKIAQNSSSFLNNFWTTVRRPKVKQWYLILWALFVPGTVLAQDLITERAWIEDLTQQLSWQEIQKQPMHPFANVLSRGFGHSTIWVRLRIDPTSQPAPAKNSEQLVLRLRPVYLNEIRVFDQLAPQGVAGVTGDHYHPRDSELDGMDFLLPIATGNAPRDIWLRVTSTSTRQISAQVMYSTDLNRITQRQQLLYAVYIALILCFALWGLIQWLFTREHVIGAFGLQQLTALLFALSALGYMRAFWPLSWPASALDNATTYLAIMAVSTAVLFHTLLIGEFRPKHWTRQALWFTPTFLSVKIIMTLTGWSLEALHLNMIEVLAMPIVFLVAIFLSKEWSAADPRERPSLSKPLIISFYLMMLAIVLMAVVPALGLAAGGEVSLYIVQVHGLLTAFLILVLLQYRAHIKQKQQQETAMALERSELQIEQDKIVREEQEKLLTMLAHELKTPLATMHMRLDINAEGNLEIKKAISDMNSVIDRCLQTTLLGDRQLVAHSVGCNVIALLRDLVSSCAHPERVQVDAPAELWTYTDRQLLMIVMNNLLENAFKYSPPHTPIHFSLQRDTNGQHITFEVRNLPYQNNWPDADQLFIKYYRSPHARRQAGSGLGLFLVCQLMQTLGGQIRYAPDSTWVRFVVQLPSLS